MLEPVILPITKTEKTSTLEDVYSRSIILSLTPINYNKKKDVIVENKEYADAVVSVVSVPYYYTEIFHDCYFVLNDLLRKVVRRRCAVIIFSFIRPTKVYETTGYLTLISINYKDYLEFLLIYRNLRNKNELHSDDIIIIFNKLEWCHAYHILNKVGFRVSGGSHTKRHLLSLSQYRLLEFLTMASKLHQILDLEHKDRLDEFTKSGLSYIEITNYNDISSLIKNSFYNTSIQKDPLLTRKYKLFMEINKILLKNTLIINLFNDKLDSMSMFYQTLDLEISEEGLKISIAPNYKDKYENILNNVNTHKNNNVNKTNISKRKFSTLVRSIHTTRNYSTVNTSLVQFQPFKPQENQLNNYLLNIKEVIDDNTKDER